jgi:hypothetical protein
MMSREEISVLKASPAWPARAAAAPTVPRELRAEGARAFDTGWAAKITVPVLLLVGADSPQQIKANPEVVAAALLDAWVAVLQGQTHIAHLAGRRPSQKRSSHSCAAEQPPGPGQLLPAEKGSLSASFRPSRFDAAVAAGAKESTRRWCVGWGRSLLRSRRLRRGWQCALLVSPFASQKARCVHLSGKGCRRVRDAPARRAAPTGAPMSCRQSKKEMRSKRPGYCRLAWPRR